MGLAGAMRRLASVVVTCVGWAALLATTSYRYEWNIRSSPVALDLDVQAGGTVVERFIVHVDGHPQILSADIYLALEEPGVEYTPYVDGGAWDLPVVEAPTVIAPQIDQLRSEPRFELRYVAMTRCEALPCDIEFDVRAEAGGTALARHFILRAGAHGLHTNDAPPGIVTLTRGGNP